MKLKAQSRNSHGGGSSVDGQNPRTPRLPARSQEEGGDGRSTTLEEIAIAPDDLRGYLAEAAKGLLRSLAFWRCFRDM